MFNCASSGTQVKPDTSVQQPERIAVEENALFTLVVKEGADKENVVGTLMHRGREIPCFFIHIEDIAHAYSCYDFEKDRHLPFYRKVPGRKNKQSQQRLSEQDLSRGWYLGSQRKVDALPGKWIYAEWEGGAAFFKEDRFLDIIINEPFTAIFRKK